MIPTPQSILDDTGRDVFEEIITDGEEYADEKRAALWSRYAYRGIGSCDTDYWIKAMQRRYQEIAPTYDLQWRAWEQWLTANASTIDMSDGTSEYETVTGTEDNPDNPQGDTVYLSDRVTVRYNGKQSGGLSIERAVRFRDAVYSVGVMFSDEFREQFFFGC